MEVETGYVVPFQTSAIFCVNCGMLLRLESSSSKIQCKFCKQVTDIKDLMGEEVVTSKVITQGKEWMSQQKDADEEDRAIVEQDCEKDDCDNN